ncbi:unnamed protein product [Onchocerca flexuosa]|uniref:Secreted protein n=1 Tax=Onchocerca flexuosa TaxID=387005 RepID=A0A183H613_9BILA|nr:unnamed protein product [Onchocerca flexuosa]
MALYEPYMQLYVQTLIHLSISLSALCDFEMCTVSQAAFRVCVYAGLGDGDILSKPTIHPSCLLHFHLKFPEIPRHHPNSTPLQTT